MFEVSRDAAAAGEEQLTRQLLLCSGAEKI
jgi:hypothetical protein